MASLANQTISSTYDGLIKTSTDDAVPASGVQLLEDGSGNSLAISIGRANNGVTVTGTVTATAFVGDGSGLTGVSTNPTLDDVTTNGSTTTNSITVGNVTATSFIKSGGTSAQFLKADGTVDSNTYLTSFTETNDLTAAVVWANVPDANITQSSVTQHQAAISITESQISDLQSYLTAESDTLDSVTGRGASTTNAVTVGGATVNGNLSVTGTIADSSGDVGTSGQILSSTGTGTNWIAAPTGGGGTTYTIQEISTNTTAQKDYLYVMRASLTLTLPASPSVGDKVAVANMSGTITPVVARNGNLIAGLAEDMTIDVDSISVEFIYSGANEGWILFVDSILGYTSTTNVNGSGTTNYISKWSDADTLTDSGISDDGSTITLSTSSTERMRIDSSGAVSIGTTDALSRKFRVYGSGDLVDITSTNTGVGGAQIDLRQESSSPANGDVVGIINFNGRDSGLQGTQYAGIQGIATDVGAESGALAFGTRTNASTYSEKMRILPTGGITFNGGTAAANALDDYEEGTFTPEVADAVTGGNQASGSFNGSYVKVGSMVTVTVILNNIDTTGMTGTNSLVIRNLPFAPSPHSAHGAVSMHTVSLVNTSYTYAVAEIIANNRYAIIRQQGSGVGDYTTIVSQIDSSGSDIYFTITYKA